MQPDRQDSRVPNKQKGRLLDNEKRFTPIEGDAQNLPLG